MSDLLLALAVVAISWAWWRQRRLNQQLRHEQEILRRKQEELIQLNQTKELLFTALAHDVRSPLSSLYSLLTLLDLGTVPRERLNGHKERLTHTLNTTLELLDSLLCWSAAHLQESRPQAKVVALDALIMEAVASMKVEAERKHIHLHYKISQPHTALTDPDMTRLVLRNLLTNAIKFTPEFGVVRLAIQPQGDFWEVAITDTGVGIAADYPNILSESNLHSTPGTAAERGAGLGLRLCSEFVKRIGGQLSFQTAAGEGSTFCFTIPMAAELVPDAALTPPTTVAG